MASVVREKVLINKSTFDAVSDITRVESTSTHIIAELNGTGALSATVNIYGGIYNTTTGNWDIKQLDGSFVLSSTGNTSGRVAIASLTRYIQVEVVGLTGTLANISVGAINLTE